MRYQYIGLDLSLTGSGVVVLRHHGVAVRRTLKNRMRGYERLAWCRDGVAEGVREAQEASRLPVGAVVEGYAFGAAHKAHDIGELGGVVRTMLFEGGVPFALVPPPTLKKFATGAGNAPKDTVLMQVLKWRWRIITRAMPTRWRGSASCCAATRTGCRRRRSWSACGGRRW